MFSINHGIHVQKSSTEYLIAHTQAALIPTFTQILYCPLSVQVLLVGQGCYDDSISGKIKNAKLSFREMKNRHHFPKKKKLKIAKKNLIDLSCFHVITRPQSPFRGNRNESPHPTRKSRPVTRMKRRHQHRLNYARAVKWGWSKSEESRGGSGGRDFPATPPSTHPPWKWFNQR